ncbi:MAG: ribonuclease III domain-containing protein [Benjaminiella poitrasii]|nr:MAG: ribonuclease III domain-containing protein [Benjaminiella poitrasii]
MLTAISKSQSLSTKLFAAIKTAPRWRTTTMASLHTQPTSTETIDPSISALGARLGLQSLKPSLLKQALTHKSLADDQPHTNATLEFIGKRVTGLFATEYLHCKYPRLHPSAFAVTIRSLIGNDSFSKIATEVGLQHSVSWKQSTDDSQHVGRKRVLADCFNALVGIIFQEQGIDAAKSFVHNFVLSRDFDISPVLKVKEPKRHLSALLRQLQMKSAESRLLSETGRLSSSPVFIVGVFSGKKKLAEGFGSSIKMAEFRACENALIDYYGQEYKDFILPSDADKVDRYTPAPLGNTQAII